MPNKIQNYFNEHKYLVVADPDFMPNLPLHAEIWSDDVKYLIIPGQDVTHPEFYETLRNYHLQHNCKTSHWIVRNHYLADGTRRCCKSVSSFTEYELTGLERLYKHLSGVKLAVSTQEPPADVKAAMVLLDGVETWIYTTPDIVHGPFEDIVRGLIEMYDPAIAITYRN